jgi:hypothetical protein
MTFWEKKIIDAFIEHYFKSAGEADENRALLRLRSPLIFPDFEKSSADKKETYLEAAEALEKKGIAGLHWEKRAEGERLTTLSCENFEKLFEEAGRPYPKTEAEKIRVFIAQKISDIKKQDRKNGEINNTYENIISMLEYFAVHFGPREIGQGLNLQTMEEFIRYLQYIIDPVKTDRLTIRALSILLFRDSKYLEHLLALCAPLINRSKKNIPGLRLALHERAYPETMISGKIIIHYENTVRPLVNEAGIILGLPLESVEYIRAIHPLIEKNEKAVLTIENKETFYALGSPKKHITDGKLSKYDCFLYIGGYFNRAASSLINILSQSGFIFYHAGDLDPDGILILQQIQETAQKPVHPVNMDTEVFEKYQPWAYQLSKAALNQISKINQETRNVPQLAELLRRIQETGLGVEQEIIDYR